MAKKNLKTSETAIIKRSEIKLNPLNPKRHSEKVIKLQKKNLQQVGFLGGIVWNRTTGNLIDGHRRIYAMDLYYGYDGKENDYDVKVEVVEMSVKAEKAQLTYMAIGNTKPEKDLIARYIGDIDKDIIPDLGFEDDELKDILAIADDNSNGMVEDALGDFLSDDDIVTEGLAETQPPAVANHDTPTEKGVSTDTSETDDEAKKAHVKSIKEKTEKLAAARQQSENAYTILSFSTADAKAAFMDIVGCNPDAKFVKGEDVLRLIE